MIAAQSAFDHAAHRELIQAPCEIDESDKQQERSDCAARR